MVDWSILTCKLDSNFTEIAPVFLLTMKSSIKLVYQWQIFSIGIFELGCLSGVSSLERLQVLAQLENSWWLYISACIFLKAFIILYFYRKIVELNSN